MLKCTLYFMLLVCLSNTCWGQKGRLKNYSKISIHLEKMLDTDQKWRDKDIEMSTKPGFDRNSKEALALKDSFIRNDSINHYYVDSILRNYGWLDTNKISRKANMAIFLVVQHAQPKYMIANWPIIRKAYKSGALLPKDYALMYDRAQVYKGKKQLYGSQTQYYNGRLFIAPVKRRWTLNKRRKKMGLVQSEEEYIKTLEDVFKKKIYGIK